MDGFAAANRAQYTFCLRPCWVSAFCVINLVINSVLCVCVCGCGSSQSRDGEPFDTAAVHFCPHLPYILVGFAVIIYFGLRFLKERWLNP